MVAILPPMLGEESLMLSLRVLFHSEYNYTLCEKMVPRVSIYKDPFFNRPYRHVNSEFCYGHFPKEYLCARKVKDLHCEESKKDCFETTLYWMELPKYVLNPDVDPDGPLPHAPEDCLKQVHGGREVHYTYSLRPDVEAQKKLRAKRRTE